MAVAAHGTLSANQVTTVTVTPGPHGITVTNRSMAGEIWVRVDGHDPAVAGPDTFVVLGTRTFPQRQRGAPLTVKLLATEARAYSVEAS